MQNTRAHGDIARMLKIGIGQVANHFDYDANFCGIENAMRNMASRGADLAFFPECVTTGYNSKMLKIDVEKLSQTVDRIRALAKELSLAVALPTPRARGDEFLNSVLFIDEEGQIQHHFDKWGLQKGEERIFSPGESHSRAFSFRGFKLGVVICVETTHGPWDYVKPEDELDLILWPGFYAPRDDGSRSGADDSVEANLKEWQVPLLLANCASSPEREFWPGRQFGGSGIKAASGEEVFKAKRDEEEFFIVTVGKDRSVRVV